MPGRSWEKRHTSCFAKGIMSAPRAQELLGAVVWSDLLRGRQNPGIQTEVRHVHGEEGYKVTELLHHGESGSSKRLSKLPRWYHQHTAEGICLNQRYALNHPTKLGYTHTYTYTHTHIHIYTHTYTYTHASSEIVKSPESLENWLTDRHRICGRT